MLILAVSDRKHWTFTVRASSSNFIEIYQIFILKRFFRKIQLLLSLFPILRCGGFFPKFLFEAMLDINIVIMPLF